MAILLQKSEDIDANGFYLLQWNNLERFMESDMRKTDEKILNLNNFYY